MQYINIISFCVSSGNLLCWVMLRNDEQVSIFKKESEKWKISKKKFLEKVCQLVLDQNRKHFGRRQIIWTGTRRKTGKRLLCWNCISGVQRVCNGAALFNHPQPPDDGEPRSTQIKHPTNQPATGCSSCLQSGIEAKVRL